MACLFLPKAPENKTLATILTEEAQQLDFLGTTLLVSGIVCLIQASKPYRTIFFSHHSANTYSGAMVVLWLAWFSATI